MQEYRLIIDAVDERGLILKVTEVLFKHNINIDRNSEYVDADSGKFFMRSVISGDLDSDVSDVVVDQLKAILPKNSHIKITENKKKDMVILATKESHCLGDIIIKHQSDELDANIVAVISNYSDLCELVEKFYIPYHHISHEGLNRCEHEAKIIKVIKSYNPELIILAKYMRILTQDIVQEFKLQVINIHHSFLPAFIGANPYKQAHQRGVKIIGATAHYVTDDLDEGPIIAQDVVGVDHNYTWKDMRKSGRDMEKIVLSRAIELALEDRIFVHGNKTVIL